MNRLRAFAAGASLFVGALSGCSDPGVEVEASITGFARGTGYEIVQTDWVYRQGENVPFFEDTRNEHPIYVDVCVERSNPDIPGIEIDTPDDFGCGWTSDCWSGPDTHCVSETRQHWTWQQKEENSVMQCPPPLETNIIEYKSETQNAEDSTCKNKQLATNQRLESALQYMVRVEAANPDYDEEKPDEEPETVRDVIALSSDEWAQASRTAQVIVRISNGNVTDIKLQAA